MKIGWGGFGNKKKNMHRHKITPVGVFHLLKTIPCCGLKRPNTQGEFGKYFASTMLHHTVMISQCNLFFLSSTPWKNPSHLSVAILNWKKYYPSCDAIKSGKLFLEIAKLRTWTPFTQIYCSMIGFSHIPKSRAFVQPTNLQP